MTAARARRGRRLRGRAFALIPCLAVGAPDLARADGPLDWPNPGAGEAALALHCAAVMTSLGLAHVTASALAGAPEGLPPGTLPAPVLEAAGGAERLGDIRARAETWERHVESLAATLFYPRLTGDGTPYLADEGRALMQAAEECRRHFGP